MDNNILYILGHKTLTDFEVPILIKKGYGVLVAKKFDSISTENNTVVSDPFKYDDFLNLDINIINNMNDIDWYNNNEFISDDIINMLNKYFKIIFVTLLTNGKLLEQLTKNFKGMIYYRFFGRESNHRYNFANISHNIKYIFSYNEIFEFEKSFDNFFTSNNSHVVPLGLSNNFICKWKNKYNPIINKICFICCKINLCSYYTNIYNEFTNKFKNYDYLVIGKNNKIKQNNILNDLDDYNFYKKISECKLMYYHSQEERHLHYHPIEGIIIGIPIIFYEKSILSKFLKHSEGKCSDINEVYDKINRILMNDSSFINKIIEEQNKIIDIFTINYNENIFNEILT